jgi:hypothetical protein
MNPALLLPPTLPVGVFLVSARSMFVLYCCAAYVLFPHMHTAFVQKR